MFKHVLFISFTFSAPISICMQKPPRSINIERPSKYNDNYARYYTSTQGNQHQESSIAIVNISKRMQYLQKFFYCLTCKYCCSKQNITKNVSEPWPVDQSSSIEIDFDPNDRKKTPSSSISSGNSIASLNSQ